MSRMNNRADRRERAAAAAISLAALLALAAPVPAAAQAPSKSDGGKSGQQVYESVCVVCHGSGAMDSPKFGDEAKWKPLIKEGQRALTRAAIKGIRGMPPRGGNAMLSDREVERAVVYMANAAGANFKDPK